MTLTILSIEYSYVILMVIAKNAGYFPKRN